MHSTDVIEPDLFLGPFTDLDDSEIIPCTTEATDAAIERTLGDYRVLSPRPELHGRTIPVTPEIMTAFIQADWNQVMEGQLPGAELPEEGFLLAYVISRNSDRGIS